VLVPLLDLDLTDRQLYVDGFPHDLFTALRQQSPIHRHRQTVIHGPLDDGRESDEFAVLLGHSVVQQANRDWETFSAEGGPAIIPADVELRSHSLVSADPPQHTRLRRLINAGFTPRVVANLDERILKYTTKILDEVIERDGNIDFVRDVAYLLPMQMIADIVGIAEADRPRIFALVDTTFQASDPRNQLTPADYKGAMVDLHVYAQALGDEKRANPTDDVWSLLAAAQVDQADGASSALSVTELDRFFTILAIAGSETTRNALTAGMRAFAEHPDQFELLAAHPELMESAVDEVIRWASPVTMFARDVTRDVDLGGFTLRKGERITMWYPSANRDENVFDDPFRFDITRRPNPHVSFGGGGVHYCLGANLAKREVHIMFEEIIRRFKRADIAGTPTFTNPGDVIAATAEHLPMRMIPR
jgi:cytochrome P450